MGFDIECIIDILSYPGEYFCPVCRTLVYPNEALVSLCTHLYCKPCLLHISNTTRSCPYDGYLATEQDAKPLMDTNKALAENIGKVKVHCLYFRSGCTWEGTLSDCTSHCSGCSFGNSPVICNRCGIQIVHRQVHDHAQNCPGVYEGQQAVGGVSGLGRSGTTSSASTTEVNQTVAQSGAPLPQAQNPQNVAPTLVPGQNPNLLGDATSQALVVAPVAVPTPEQWYQQQYQQYYQQYMGYDPYQQSSQQYYPLQQQPFQQFQQHPVQIQGQHQSHLYSQAVPQSQPQPQPQSQLLPQPQPQSQLLPQPQPQPQSQPQPQPQPQQHPQLQPQPQPQQHPQLQAQPQPNPVPHALQQPHLQPQAQGQAQSQPQPQLQQPSQAHPQVPPQGQGQVQAPIQALAPNYQVNLQQQSHPPVRPPAQMLPQTLPPPPQSQSTQPAPFAQAIGMRPPAQHPQVPQYQQPHVQMHHPQASQTHVPPQMHPQSQPHTQSSNQSHVQIQPQALPYHTQSQHPIFTPQANQSTAPAALPPAPHPAVPPVSGHHSYQQPQPAQKMQSGVAQQHPVHAHPASGSLHAVPVHGQVPQQPALMRPPHPHGSLPQQQPSTLLLPQNQVSGIPPPQHQPFPTHAQQSMQPLQHRPFMQPVPQAQPQHYTQQQHFPAPLQSQLHQQGHLQLQQPVQSHMRPSGPPQPQQTQNYVGRPMMPNHGMHPQSLPFSSTGVGPPVHSGPAQFASTQISINQSYGKSTVMEQNAAMQDIRSPSKGLVEKVFEGESLKEAVATGTKETVEKDGDNAAKDGLVNSVIKQEGDDVQGVVEQASGGKSFEAGGAEDEFSKEEGHSSADSDSLEQVDLENPKMKSSKPVVLGPSPANFDKQPHTAVAASITEGHVLPPQSHGSHQQRPQVQLQGQPPAVLGPQGPGVLPYPGQSLNPTEGRGPGNFGPSFKSFESQSGPQGSALTIQADPRGIIGRVPPHRFEGPYGPQVGRPSEVAMPKDQMPGSAYLPASGDGGPFMKTRMDGPSFFRMNGAAAPDSSMFGPRDEKSKALTREHLNPFPGEPTRSLDQASKSLDKAPHGPMDPSALGPPSRFLPNHPSVGHGHADVFGQGPDFGQHHMKNFAHRSPDREYLGSSPHGFGSSSFPRGTSAFNDINSREAHRFGEGSRSFNLSSEPVGNPFRDSRFPLLAGHTRRGDIDGPANPRFGEHMPPGMLHNQIGSDDVFGLDGPGHLMRGKFSGPGYLPGHYNMAGTAGGPGAFPGHGRADELGGPGNFPRLPYTESGRVDRSSFPHFVEPAMRNNYSLPGFPNAGNFAGGMDSFDQSRKRKPVSTGWCRICEIDCETVEGLDMHSQTREHQKMAMDMVKRIKLQNKKKQRTSAGHKVHEGGSRSKKAGIVGRGSKP